MQGQLIRKIAVLSVIFYKSSIAIAYDGNQLNKFLNSQNAIEQTIAYGYIQAVDDAHTITGNVGLWGNCYVPPIEGEQKFAIVKKYLSAHPEVWHYGANALVQDALEAAFPCETRLNREENSRRELKEIIDLKECQTKLASCKK